jgi:hypothetical protein
VIGASYPDESDGRVASNCSIFAWSGSKPTTYKQVKQKLADGTDASAYIRTWITDEQSPDASMWTSIGFDKTLSDNTTGCYAVMKALHGNVFGPPHFGAQHSIGYQGVNGAARDLCGVWDRTDTDRIIVLLLNESKHAPAVKHMEKLAKTSVAAFF